MSHPLRSPGTRWTTTRLAGVAMALSVLATDVRAQPVVASAARDSVAARWGARDGRDVGARRGAGGWLVAGVVPGLLTGFGALFALNETDDFPAYGLYVGLPALGVLAIGARHSHVSVPSELAARGAAARGVVDSVAYRRAFDSAYVTVVRRKRARRALQGGAAGTVAGAAALVGLLLAFLPAT